jgi:serine/threonine protein kinase
MTYPTSTPCPAGHRIRRQSQELRGVACVAVEFNTPVDVTPSEQLPRQIGRYTLVRRIGIGGMGAVYEALQAQPQRRVALKLIRPDQMSEELLRRFSIEVQALGRLHHAGIASIYEGGTAETAVGPQPYFVMELVEGLPLDEYVSQRQIGIREG